MVHFLYAQDSVKGYSELVNRLELRCLASELLDQGEIVLYQEEHLLLPLYITAFGLQTFKL